MKRRDFLAKAKAALLVPVMPALTGGTAQCGAALPKSEWVSFPRVITVRITWSGPNNAIGYVTSVEESQ